MRGVRLELLFILRSAFGFRIQNSDFGLQKVKSERRIRRQNEERHPAESHAPHPAVARHVRRINARFRDGHGHPLPPGEEEQEKSIPPRVPPAPQVQSAPRVRLHAAGQARWMLSDACGDRSQERSCGGDYWYRATLFRTSISRTSAE